MKLPGCDLLVIADLRGRLVRIEDGRSAFGEVLAVGGTLTPLLADEAISALLDLLLAVRRTGVALERELLLSALAGGGRITLAALAHGDELVLLGGRDDAACLASCRRLASHRGFSGLGISEAMLRELAVLAGGETMEATTIGELAAKLAAKERDIARLETELAQLRGEIRNRQ